VDDVHRATRLVALLVRVLERRTDAAHHQQGQVQRQAHAALAGASQDRAQIASVHILHRDVVGLLEATQVVDLDDARMREAGDHLGLVDEHVHELLVVREVRQDAFDRDDLLEALDTAALGAIDLGHASDRDAVEQRVGAKGAWQFLRRAAALFCSAEGAFHELGQVDLFGRTALGHTGLEAGALSVPLGLRARRFAQRLCLFGQARIDQLPEQVERRILALRGSRGRQRRSRFAS